MTTERHRSIVHPLAQGVGGLPDPAMPREALERMFGPGSPEREATIRDTLSAVSIAYTPIVGCHDCGLPCREPEWADLIIPLEEWIKISPSGDDGGTLCANCMVARASAAGVRCIARWRSGPFCEPDDLPSDGRQEPAPTEPRIAEAAFAAWFRKNYPGRLLPGGVTEIHDPDWHSPKIFRAVLAALAQPAEDREGERP